MKMKKYSKLLTDLYSNAVVAVDPYQLVLERITLEDQQLTVAADETLYRYNLSDYQQILMVAVGKGAARMALGLEEILGERLQSGLAVVKPGINEKLSIVEVIEAGHPIPNENSLRAAYRIARMAREADEKTLVINCISGGGSALMVYPWEWTVDGKITAITLEELQEAFALLLGSGATVHEMNCVRKHLSGIKGGRLARYLYPANSLNLYLSDVIGDQLDVIASGPLAPDNTTFVDVQQILEQYQILSKMPESIQKMVSDGVSGKIEDTPDETHYCFTKTKHVMLANNRTAVDAIQIRSADYSIESLLLNARLTGEAREIGKFLYGTAATMRERVKQTGRPLLVICGGESTVTLRGSGKGGRSQEIAVSFMNEMYHDQLPIGEYFILAASTDGSDGPTDAAGGLVGTPLLQKIYKTGLRPEQALIRNDSYHFLDQLGALFRTGPTNTNVCDLILLLIES